MVIVSTKHSLWFKTDTEPEEIRDFIDDVFDIKEELPDDWEKYCEGNINESELLSKSKRHFIIESDEEQNESITIIELDLESNKVKKTSSKRKKR